MSRKVNVNKFAEESLRDTTERGVKQGVVKNTVDKSLEKFTDPIAEQLQNLLRKVHPDASIADEGVKSFVHFLALNGAAEVVAHSAPVTTKIPGLKNALSEEKVDVFGRWLRGYSGEQAGTMVSDTAFAIAPVLANMMSDPSLKQVLDNITPAVSDAPQLPEAKDESVDLESEIEQLSEDDEGDNG